MASESGSSASTTVKAKPRIEQQCDEIKIGLNGLFGGVAALVGNFDSFDGQCLAVGSPPFVDACVRAARQDSTMRGWLLSIVHVSAYSDIALYGAMMLVPIAMHHFPSLFSLTSLGGSQDGEHSDN